MSAAVNANKVNFGLSNVHYALLGAGGTYETPKPIKGAVKLSAKPEGKQSTFYADNMAFATFSSNGGYTGEIEFASLTADIAKDLLGEKSAANFVTYEVADAKPAPFALLFEVEGNIEDKRYALYNCTVTRPEVNAETTGDDVKPTTVTLSFTAIPTEVEVAGKKEPVVKGCVENTTEAKKAYDQWMTKVTLPGVAIV